VLASLEAGRHLLLSAPTGVGKTAAALYPAVKLALATGRRVVFLTAKTLQQQLAVETLKRMQQGGWSSLQVRAKGRMCANDEVICHEEFCAFARDYGLKLDERGVLPALRTSAPHLDPDRVFEVAKAAEVCPFEVSLELIDGTTAIVCDYNYVFDPAIALFGLAESGSLEDTYLIVDEAHNLVDRAREYFSPRLSRRRVGEARRLLEGYRQKVCRDLDAVLADLEEAIGGKVAKALEGKTGVDRIELEVAPLAAVRLELDALIAPFFTFKRDVEKTHAFSAVLAYGGAMAYVYLADRSRCAGDDDVCRWEDPPRYEEDVLAAAEAFAQANGPDSTVPRMKGSLDMIFVRKPRPVTDVDLPFEVYLGGGKTMPIDAYLEQHPHPTYVALATRMHDLAVGIHGERAGDVVLLAHNGDREDPRDRYYFAAPYRSWFYFRPPAGTEPSPCAPSTPGSVPRPCAAEAGWCRPPRAGRPRPCPRFARRLSTP